MSMLTLKQISSWDLIAPSQLSPKAYRSYTARCEALPRQRQALPARGKVEPQQGHDVLEPGAQHVVQQQHRTCIGRQFTQCGQEGLPDLLAGRAECGAQVR